MKRVAIVGSRRRNSNVDRIAVFTVLHKLQGRYGDELVVVSGGATRGADAFAKEWAQTSKCRYVEFQATLEGEYDRATYAAAKYARNKTIVEFSNEIHAFVSADRKGGTENTVEWAKKLNKAYHIYHENGKEEHQMRLIEE